MAIKFISQRTGEFIAEGSEPGFQVNMEDEGAESFIQKIKDGAVKPTTHQPDIVTAKSPPPPEQVWTSSPAGAPTGPPLSSDEELEAAKANPGEGAEKPAHKKPGRPAKRD